MILVSRVTGSRSNDGVEPHPEQYERVDIHKQQRTVARKVVQVLCGVHGQTSERLDVGRMMVCCMDVLVQEVGMDHPVRKVELCVTVGRHHPDTRDERNQHCRHRRQIGWYRQSSCLVAVQESSFREVPLDDPQHRVNDIVNDLDMDKEGEN